MCAVTPITPLTDMSAPFKGTHELSPQATGGSIPRPTSQVMLQWPNELEGVLDNMAATEQPFLGRYDIAEGSERLRSAQGLVQIATCRTTQQKVRGVTVLGPFWAVVFLFFVLYLYLCSSQPPFRHPE